MNWTIDFTTEFSKGAKVLKKRYKSFMKDLEEFNESQGQVRRFERVNQGTCSYYPEVVKPQINISA